MKRLVLVLTCVALLASAACAATNYQLTKKVAVPGTGGWDYVAVDEAARRVYITHATQVDVLDADSLAVVGTIPNVTGAHGVAIPPNSAAATFLRANRTLLSPSI